MGQYSGYPNPRETTAPIKSLPAQGQRGFSIALDLRTQNGLDSVGEITYVLGTSGAPTGDIHDG